MNPEPEHLRRWRLILGGDEADVTRLTLEQVDLSMDRCLQALYDAERNGGLGESTPHAARWLGDIRDYFPNPIVRVMQQDALDRLGVPAFACTADLFPDLMATAIKRGTIAAWAASQGIAVTGMAKIS